jgi:hypothetical protein
MPPPPPPSKSYLLVLDTDSEDEEEEPGYQRAVTPTSPMSNSDLDHSSPPDTASEYSPPHVVEDDEELMENEATQASTSKLRKSQKKNRNRRKKRNNKAASATETTQRRVSFANVIIRVFPRCFSLDTVPADGGWPLGLEREALECTEEVNLEEYERQKQENLKERWERVLEKPCDADVIENMTKRPPGIPHTFETRRWDYRSSIRNPLFGVLHEQDRQALFLGVDVESLEHKDPPPKRRTRANSVASDHSGRRSRSNSVSTSAHFNETYTQVVVHHVRNELEELRNERTRSGATGCTCRKLTVYLPPKDGSAGKKAQHRRMKPAKLTEELKKRGLYNHSASREALEKTLHDAVEKEPCCLGDDCFCARNGIDCQSDACSCWYDSHVHAKPAVFPSNEDIKSRCGNANGMYTVDTDGIDAFRSNALKSLICQPIGSI